MNVHRNASADRTGGHERDRGFVRGEASLAAGVGLFLASFLLMAAGCGGQVPKPTSFGVYRVESGKLVSLPRCPVAVRTNIGLGPGTSSVRAWTTGECDSFDVVPFDYPVGAGPETSTVVAPTVVLYEERVDLKSVGLYRARFELFVRDIRVWTSRGGPILEFAGMHSDAPGYLGPFPSSTILRIWDRASGGFRSHPGDWPPGRVDAYGDRTGWVLDTRQAVDLDVAPVKGLANAYVLRPKPRLEPGLYALVLAPLAFESKAEIVVLRVGTDEAVRRSALADVTAQRRAYQERGLDLSDYPYEDDDNDFVITLEGQPLE